MTHWMPEIDHRKGPRYLAIADAIGEAVERGHLKPGEKLPTHRDLAYDLGVTVGTVSRAYAEAVRRDYVSGEVGRGTYVKNKTLSEQSPFHIPYDIAGDMIDFGLNFPAEGERVELVRQSLMAISQDPGLGALMRYQSEQGMEHHRHSFAKWATHLGAPGESERIIVSCGVQHAMTLSLMATSRPGQTLLCEEYTYPGIKTLAAQFGVKLHGIAMDHEGLIPERLEEALIQSGARLLYCMPNFQNPTGTIMGEARRKEIAAIAQKYHVTILEDDIYGFLLGRDNIHTPLCRLLPDQTLYMNGASKCISPGLRIGFILAPEGKVQTLAACMRMNSWMVSPLNAEITARWVEDGTAFELMDWHCREAYERQLVMKNHFKDFTLMSADNAYHAWLHLPEPWHADMYCLRAQERNVNIMPAQVFYAGKYSPINAVRLCYGAPSSLEIVDEGMARLENLIREDIHAFRAVM